MLHRISIGWRWLENALNSIIDEVNLNAPIGSSSITADQSPNGTVLRVVGQNDQSPQQQANGGGGGTAGAGAGGVWTPLQVMDDQCNQSTIYVWAKPQ